METITPDNLRAIYFEQPGDDQRLVEVMLGDDGGSLKVEIIRTEESDGSSRQRQLDLEAQHKLCETTQKAQHILSEAFAIEEERVVPPGANIRFKERVRLKRKSSAKQGPQKQIGTY